MLLSVVVPTWNSERLVRSFLQSWASGGSSWSRLVVIDDGSTDGTLEFLAQQGGIPAFVLATQDNAGPGASRNLGLSAVDTPFVTFADVDDTINWKALRVAATTMSEIPTLDVLTDHGAGRDDESAPLRLERSSPSARTRFLWSRMAVWGRIYRTSLLRDLEPLFPVTRAAEDVLASARIADMARSFAYADFGFYQHETLSAERLTKSNGYVERALESLDLLAHSKQRRLTKAVVLAASASYFARRGALGAAAKSAALMVRGIIDSD
jgi:glycosyltransferase involved in cell wall biosynthesis